ncbi:MAG: hypothetical protein P8184_16995 [Calditrichia bacterium]
MFRYRKILTGFLFLAVLIQACKNQNMLFVPSEPEPTDSTIKLDISPPIVRTGFITAITGAKFNHNQFDYHVVFPDSTITYPYSVSEDSMFVIVPYVTKSGTLKVSSYDFEGEGIITILNDCEEGVCVKGWDLNYTITEEESWTYDGFGNILKWTLQSFGDTLFLKKEGSGPNYDMHRYLYFLNDSSNSLPKFLKGEIYIYGAGARYYEIDRAVIKIQDWDPDGIFSGVLFFTRNYYDPFIDIFWVDIKRIVKPE